MSSSNLRYIEIQPSLINFYNDFPVYIIHPKGNHVVRFLARGEEYSPSAVSALMKRGIKVYVDLEDHRKRSKEMQKRLAEYLNGPFDAQKSLVIKETTIQLVNEFLATRMSESGEILVDPSGLKRLQELVEHYVALLDLDHSEDILRMLHRVMVKDWSTTAHSVNVMLLTLRYRGGERGRMFKEIVVPKEVIANRDQMEAEAARVDRRWALGAILHDIGMVKLSPEILEAKGRLTPQEQFVFKTHVNHGWDILKDMGKKYAADELIVGAVLHHHERLDGTGYPLGLRRFSLSGQIVGLLDRYERLTTESRPLGRGMSPFRALSAVKKETQAGKFDPAHFRTLVELVAMD